MGLPGGVEGLREELGLDFQCIKVRTHRRHGYFQFHDFIFDGHKFRAGAAGFRTGIVEDQRGLLRPDVQAVASDQCDIGKAIA